LFFTSATPNFKEELKKAQFWQLSTVDVLTCSWHLRSEAADASVAFAAKS
jgi:hypothetical protein